jgi:hypothetical protein
MYPQFIAVLYDSRDLHHAHDVWGAYTRRYWGLSEARARLQSPSGAAVCSSCLHACVIEIASRSFLTAGCPPMQPSSIECHLVAVTCNDMQLHSLTCGDPACSAKPT